MLSTIGLGEKIKEVLLPTPNKTIDLDKFGSWTLSVNPISWYFLRGPLFPERYEGAKKALFNQSPQQLIYITNDEPVKINRITYEKVELKTTLDYNIVGGKPSLSCMYRFLDITKDVHPEMRSLTESSFCLICHKLMEKIALEEDSITKWIIECDKIKYTNLQLAMDKHLSLLKIIHMKKTQDHTPYHLGNNV